MVNLAETKANIQAIGLVTMRWASVDLKMADVLGSILQNEEAGMSCIFDNVDSGVQRFEAFIAIVGTSALSEDDRKLLICAAKKLKKLLRERNRIVHSPLVLNAYADGERMGMQLGRVGRKEKHNRFKAVTVEDMTSHADAVQAEAKVFLEWSLKNRS